MKNINVIQKYGESGVDCDGKIEQAKKRGAIVFENCFHYSDDDLAKIGENQEVFKIHTYGRPFHDEIVRCLGKKDENGRIYHDPYGVHGRNEEKKIVGHVSESFTVEDDLDGIEIVAKACGYGHSYLTEEADAELDEFDQPDSVLLTFGVETAGYREVTGSVSDAFRGTIRGDLDFDEWDVYSLEPGMEDGGIVVQSSSSGSMVEAQKKGDKWEITLTVPKFEDGSVYSTGTYADYFNRARSQYEGLKSEK